MVNGNALIKTSSDTNVSAAVQLAIWLIEYGNTFAYKNVSSAVMDSRSSVLEGYVKSGGQWVLPELYGDAAFLEREAEFGISYQRCRHLWCHFQELCHFLPAVWLVSVYFVGAKSERMPFPRTPLDQASRLKHKFGHL